MTNTMPPPPKTAPKGTRSAPVTQPVTDRPRLHNGAATFKPPRIVLNAVEGWGKTSMGAYAPSPAILMAAGETGYDTLLGAGLVPIVPRVELGEWAHTIQTIEELTADPQGIETLVLDALGGFERQCHEMVCARDYNNDWGEKGFTSYHKGYEVALKDWLLFLSRLERLQAAHGVTVLLLSHARVGPYKNPLGPDYDRWVADCHHKTWGATARWADAVIFGNFFTVVEGGKIGDKPQKGKGIGGTQRIVYTERSDPFDAKNRYGMPEVLDIPDDPSQIWPTVWAAIRRETT